MSKNRHKAQKKASGGKASHNQYNAVGAPEPKEAMSGDDGFRKGGKIKGGKADGMKAAKRLDKKPRRAAGGKVMSAASNVSTASGSSGHEGISAKGDD